MKKFLGFLAVLLVGTAVLAQKPVTLTVTYKFLNIVEGYDHNCKVVVYIDGKSMGESAQTKESVGGKYTVTFPSGTHDLKVMNFAEYEGSWEEHTIENEYSIDCSYEESGHNFAKSAKLFLVHDIDAKTYYSWKKPIKMNKKTGKVTIPKGQE